MSIIQPLNKNRFKGLYIHKKKSTKNVIKKSDIYGMYDDDLIKSDLKRDNAFYFETKNPKSMINCWKDHKRINMLKKIVDDYHYGAGMEYKENSDTLIRPPSRGELVNLQKSSMRKQMPNESDSNYMLYIMKIQNFYENYKSSTSNNNNNPAIISDEDNMKSLVTTHFFNDQPNTDNPIKYTFNEPLQLSNSDEGPNQNVMDVEELKAWGETMESIKNQLQLEYEENDDNIDIINCLTNTNFNSYMYQHPPFNHLPSNYDNHYKNHLFQVSKEIHKHPNPLNVQWIECQKQFHDTKPNSFNVVGESSESFNRTLYHILEYTEKSTSNNDDESPNYDNNKKYFSEKVLLEIISKFKQLESIKLTKDSIFNEPTSKKNIINDAIQISNTTEETAKLKPTFSFSTTNMNYTENSYKE